MVLQGVAGLSGNAGKRNRRGEQMSGAIPQHRKRMLAIGEEGQLFTRKEKSKQNEEKFEQKQQKKISALKTYIHGLERSSGNFEMVTVCSAIRNGVLEEEAGRGSLALYTPMARCVVLGSGLCFPICKMT